MEALKKKLKSSGGASLLIAMLFMLVCMMAGASIFMAADANASKVASNRDEQQKYLAVSSALNLLVDELTSVEFYAEYEYTMDDLDASGAVTTDPAEVHHHRHNYSLVENSFYLGNTIQMRSRTDPAVTSYNADLMTDVLPLFDNMQAALNKTFKAKVNQAMDRNQVDLGHFYDETSTVLTGLDETTVGACQLQIEADGAETVTVDVALYETRIKLTAHLNSDPDYVMKAELETDPVPSSAFNFDFEHGHITTAPIETLPVTWNLNAIAKSTA